MTQIHAQMIRQHKDYVGFIEGFGYLYRVGAELFIYNGQGLNKL